MSLHFLIKRWRPQGRPSESFFSELCVIYVRNLLHPVIANCNWLKIQWKNFWRWRIITDGDEYDDSDDELPILSKTYSLLIITYPMTSSSSSWAPRMYLMSHESIFMATSWGLNWTRVWVREWNLQMKSFHLGNFTCRTFFSVVINDDVMKYIPRPDSLWPLLQFLFWTHVQLTLRPLASQIR